MSPPIPDDDNDDDDPVWSISAMWILENLTSKTFLFKLDFRLTILIGWLDSKSLVEPLMQIGHGVHKVSNWGLISFVWTFIFCHADALPLKVFEWLIFDGEFDTWKLNLALVE